MRGAALGWARHGRRPFLICPLVPGLVPLLVPVVLRSHCDVAKEGEGWTKL